MSRINKENARKVVLGLTFYCVLTWVVCGIVLLTNYFGTIINTIALLVIIISSIVCVPLILIILVYWLWGTGHLIYKIMEWD